MEQAGKILDKSEKLNQSFHEIEYYFSYIYTKLGNKKKALEVLKDWKTSMETLKGWRTFLVLGMKEEALNYIGEQTEKDNLPRNDFLFFKNHLHHKDFDIIRRDPRFIELIEKKKLRYEINKKRFSIGGLI